MICNNTWLATILANVRSWIFFVLNQALNGYRLVIFIL
jgi:hypothetical protein